MFDQKLLTLAAVCFSTVLAACGDLRERDNDDDSDRDSDSDGSRNDLVDDGEDDVDSTIGDEDNNDDETLPGGGGGDVGGGGGDVGGGGGGSDDSDEGGGGTPPPANDPPPADEPAACPGIPAEGLCTFEGGSLVAKNCRDGEVVTRFCTPDESFNDPDDRCDITPTGALCRDTWEVKVETENPIYFCFSSGGDFYMGLFEDRSAQLLIEETEESEFGSFFIDGEDAIDRIAAIHVQIEGRAEMIFFANNSLGVAASLRDFAGSDTTCTVVNYDDETTLNVSLNCELDVGFGFDPVQSVLEFYPNGQVLSWDEFNNFAEPQEFGGYYLEGDRIYFALDQGPFSNPQGREGTVVGNTVVIDGDLDFSCD